jgi:hypothetical protein
MSEQRAETDLTNAEDETYEPPEVSDYGALVELTLSGNSVASDLAGFNTATPGGGS